MLMSDLLLQRLIGKQKAQKLCSFLTAQWMHWCLVRYFWTFCRKGLRPCGRSFVILLHYSLSLVIRLGITITNSFVQITTLVWSDSSSKVNVLRSLVHDWYALLLLVILLCGSEIRSFVSVFTQAHNRSPSCALNS